MQKCPPDLSERTFQFARQIVRLYATLPSSTLAQTLGKQLLRSGTSIGANYHEAHRSRTKPEFTSTMGICLREAQETQFWIRLLIAEQVLPPINLEPLLQETNELIAIFITIIKKSKQLA